MSVLRFLALAAALTGALPTAAIAQEATAYERGVEARLAGQPQEAAKLLETWLAQNPSDLDARVQLGYVYLALDRLADAETQFRTVKDAAPGYMDATIALETIARRRDAGKSARATLLVEGALSTLENGLDDWIEVGALLSLHVAARDRLDLRATHYERFDRTDIEVEGRYTHRAGDDSWLRFGASATPSADFRPEVGASLGYDRRLSHGSSATVAGFDAAWRSFAAQDIFDLSPYVTQYLGGSGAMSLTARAHALLAEDDAVRLGGSLRADYAPEARRRAFLGVAAGPDTDLGVVTDTYSLFGGGEIPLGNALSLSGSVAREWRDGPTDRTEFRLGIKAGL